MRQSIRARELLSLFVGILFITLFFSLRYHDSFWDSFGYLIGEGYDPQKWNIMILSGFCLLHTGYGIYAGMHLSRLQEESGYMALVRYRRYRTYYVRVFFDTVKVTLCFDAATILAIAINCIFLQNVFQMQIEWQPLAQIVALNLCSHLFWGTVLAWLIVRENRIRESLIIFPGIVFWNLILCIPLPEEICRYLPGNWLMLRRSNVMTDTGYSVVPACCVLLALWICVSLLWINARRKRSR